MSSAESQVGSAQRMYTERAHNYEDSWHPDYSRRFMELVPVHPGDHVLDLACGTGLEAVIAANQVGDEGIVIGVDITEAMLAEARKKLDQNEILARRIKLVQHNVTDLSGCPHVAKGSFDLILCSSVFVLFEDPDKVVSHWREYLKPGGKVAIDITHEYNLRAGILLEKVARRLGLSFPSNRSWIKSKDSFSDILKSQGFIVEKAEGLEKVPGLGSTFLSLDQADEQFEFVVNGPLTASIVTDELRYKGRDYFKEEWNNAAVDGKVEVSDTVYVYVARKA
ncbi:S-adenosyl-L-methionine-dependent methyltransferase [Fusarium flagelliforme]|uniref:Demethylmenaquinone methyltransferase n=1 Tax=Fusarium flagelliforme TaxID=2675880 RepID=A0A395MNZ0_9HYPO|nr:S-adenosyl-L-methionine-dependent methyltransferase [Fusarium flagelliforme]KAH7193013.1 S-adenosyl-L-methionine-dependent methyltransferase [Fusarium flagelliforme]RFN49666.1 demethylmenaquinone methyltransferase [Fusarium flagelliforme]